MPVVAGDIGWRWTEPAGPGDTNTQPDPDDSIGGYAATDGPTTGVDNDCFDDITLAENQAATVDYRSHFIPNEHATDTWYAVKVYIGGEAPGGADHAIALDGTGIVDTDSASAQAERLTDENTAPSGETFSAPTTKEAGLNVGDVPAGQGFTVIVRRTATNSAQLAGAYVEIVASGQDAAPA
jgi:hypothetical protein